MRSVARAALLVTLATPACNSDTKDTAPATEGTTSATEGTTETDAIPWEPTPAREIVITHVSANQATEVEIGRDGVDVPGDERTAFLVQNRDTLIRAYWEVDAETWQPREIEARLLLEYPDGSTKEHVSVANVTDKESTPGNLGRSFYFGMTAEEAVPGLRYRVSLWETGPGPHDELPVPDPPPELPAAGEPAGALGFENSDMSLEVVVVPFEYDVGDCTTTPRVMPDDMALYERYLFEWMPVDRVTVTLHEPVPWTEELTEFWPLNVELTALRTAEDAPPHVFYYGIIDVCSTSIGGAGGLAQGILMIPPNKDEAWARVSSGLSLSNNVDWNAETFVHEVAHTMGRRHVDGGCGSLGTDSSYPYPGGVVDQWGFGVISFALAHPTVHKSYMSYCHPQWVSPWGWNKMYYVVHELTRWANEDLPAPPDERALLVGSHGKDGRSTWFTVPGALPPARVSATDRVIFERGPGAREARRAAIYPMDHGGHSVVVPLPEDFDRVTGLIHASPAGSAAVALQDVRRLHRAPLTVP